jgi:hypothetical protein
VPSLKVSNIPQYFSEDITGIKKSMLGVSFIYSKGGIFRS